MPTLPRFCEGWDRQDGFHRAYDCVRRTGSPIIGRSKMRSQKTLAVTLYLAEDRGAISRTSRRIALVISQLASRISLTHRALSLATCLLAMVGVRPALSQTANPNAAKKSFATDTDLSLGIFGQLTPTRAPVSTTTTSFGTTIQQKTQGTTPSAGVLGTFHQSFNPWLGYNVNFGYSRFSENYSHSFSNTPTDPSQRGYAQFSQGSVPSNVFELTLAYVVQGPRTKRFNTFAQYGGGALWFLPTGSSSPFHEQARAAMVFGVGMNYRLSDHFSARAEYRGLFYKSPDFANTTTSVPISRLFTVTNAPTISVVYTFGGPH